MFEYGLLERAFQTGRHLVRRSARLQSAHYSQPPHPRALHHRTLSIDLRLPCNWDRNILRRADLHRPVKAGRSDAYDSESNIVEVDLAAYDLRVAAEPSLPVAVA